ncbi:LysE family translocator [Ramlibacter sp.]|uniref:LysE family translocator n=1 Tax=Ramlibacter sp. TaxID=1917967 RepID=UPI0017BA4DBB|nr:LysE family translocator [Ramlibacter sp.]MBA2675485.1 LysE family translocator [Ramlibacter sp.]
MDYLAIALFAVATCVTPGPNNVMLMSSGVNFGINRTMRHVVGINVGFPLMLIAIGMGAGALFRAYPQMHTGLQIAGVAYMLYLAWRIATTPTVNMNDKSGSPLGVVHAAMFQLVNPKSWIMCIGAVLAYTTPSDTYLAQVLLIALIFFVFGTPCSLVWVLFGHFLKRFLNRPAMLRVFNVAMALLLVASLFPAAREIAHAWQ